ncbi:MAG: PAS domain-containing protein, partial [Gammaproteobacteria bacterium]|nr:PAS domain-containing protein [Gammaproteobacteria bacterium]
EQALRVERGLFVAGPSVVFKWRAQEGWPVEYVSPNVASQFGYVPEEITSGKVPYSTIVHPDDIARVAAEVAAYSEQGVSSFEQSYRIAGADGRYRWIEDFTTVLRGLDGSITHYLGYLQDITERKRAEDFTQARLRLLVFAGSHSPDELLTATLDEAELLTGSSIGFYHLVEADQNTLSLHSWSTNTIRNMCSAEGSGGHYAVDQAGVWADCVRERRPLIHNDYASLPNRKGMPEGHAPVVREVVVPIFRGERIVAIIGVGNKTSNYDESDIGLISQLGDLSWDIAERMRVEENLRQMNERFSLSTRAASLGVWDWDLQKNELLWDDRMYELYGVRREDFAGAYEAWLQGIHPDDRAASDEISKQAQRGEREYDTEFRVVWPDGSIHYLKAYGQFVRDAAGKPLRMTGVNFDITERKQAEEALRREQALLNRIMVTSPVGIAVVNKDGQVTFANPQAEKIMGLSKEEITQRSYNAPGWHITAFDGGPLPDEELPFSRVMATGQPVFDVQHAIVWPDGRRVLLSINGAPLFDAQGAIEGVAFAMEDITERRQADETLRRSEHGLSEAQRIAHLGNWELDLEKNVLTWSDEIFRIFEIDPEKFGASYEAFLNAIHPEDRDMVNKAYTDSVKNKVPYDIVHRLQMPDGRIKYVNEKCETYYGADGTPIRSVGTVHDITERKQDELALLEQQAHSNSLLHLSRRLERAQSYAEILAAASDEVREQIGYRNLWVYLLSDDRQYFTALIGTGEDGSRSTAQDGAPRLTIAGDRMLEQIAEAKEIVIIEDAQTNDIVNREIVKKLGNRTIVNIPIILFDRHLGTVGVGTFGDEGVRVPSASEQKYLLAMSSHMAAALDRIYLLNERRKVEQEVQKLNRGLEQRVAERTEQLEAANKELESFSYSVSHDLRSPLRAIDGFSHILLEDYTDKLDEEGKRMLGIVRDNTTRMGHLIDDILKFSRSGRTEINAVEADMAALAREVLDELQLGVAKIANLRCEIGDLPPARCDRALMHQVFANLLSNAIKFSRKNETPTIEVGGAIQGDEIVYHVKDNGAGFDMQYADKLFGVFQRLHSVEEFEGTGIGLAIVKRIVTRHGGRVWAEGNVNEGATFYFSVPSSTRRNA